MYYDSELTARYLKGVTVYNEYRRQIGKPTFDISKTRFFEFTTDQKLSAIEAVERICRKILELKKRACAQ